MAGFVRMTQLELSERKHFVFRESFLKYNHFCLQSENKNESKVLQVPILIEVNAKGCGY